MNFPKTRSHHYIQRGLDDFIILISKHPLEVSTDTLYDWFVLTVIYVDTTHILFENHFWNEQTTLFCCFVYVQTLKCKYFILVDRLPKFFKKLRFDLLIPDIQSITNKEKLPNFLNFEIFCNTFPIVIYLLNQIKSWLNHSDHGTKINGVIAQIFPVLDISLQDLLELILDFIELVFRGN